MKQQGISHCSKSRSKWNYLQRVWNASADRMRRFFSQQNQGNSPPSWSFFKFSQTISLRVQHNLESSPGRNPNVQFSKQDFNMRHFPPWIILAKGDRINQNSRLQFISPWQLDYHCLQVGQLWLYTLGYFKHFQGYSSWCIWTGIEVIRPEL